MGVFFLSPDGSLRGHHGVNFIMASLHSFLFVDGRPRAPGNVLLIIRIAVFVGAPFSLVLKTKVFPRFTSLSFLCDLVCVFYVTAPILISLCKYVLSFRSLSYLFYFLITSFCVPPGFLGCF